MRTIPPLPDELWDNWGRAYQYRHVRAAKCKYISAFEKYQQVAGVTDRLIVDIMEEALAEGKYEVLSWTDTVLAGLVPYGITTPEQRKAFEVERNAEEKRLAEQRATAQAERQTAAREKAQPKGGQQRGKTSNVFLRREKMKNYDHVFKKFDD